ncbi:MAG: hypothetical protein P8Z30_17100 [Acidobacteriota bacterium]
MRKVLSENACQCYASMLVCLLAGSEAGPQRRARPAAYAPDSRQDRNVCRRALQYKRRLCEAALSTQNRKKNAFLKNKAGELLKTKDLSKKQTENKAETKLANALKIIEGPKKQS